MKNKANFTLYKPEKMSSNRFDRLCRKLVQILEKLEVDVHAKKRY
jgi:ribosomal protein L33